MGTSDEAALYLVEPVFKALRSRQAFSYEDAGLPPIKSTAVNIIED